MWYEFEKHRNMSFGGVPVKVHFQDWAGHCVEVFFTGIKLVFPCIQVPVSTEKHISASMLHKVFP